MPPAATWMDLEIIILSEVNQKDKGKYHMISLICEILKNGINELIYKTEIDPQATVKSTGHSQKQIGRASCRERV